MASVTFDRATLVYKGAERPSVDGLSLDIADGELLVLVGPSGSGKSTALRMLAGLEETTSGRILIGGEEVTDKGPDDRDIAMVFQNYGLYPHMTVAQNMGFNLKLRKTPKAEIERLVREAARKLDIEELLDRKPASLSGGQRQRVAMGRAIVRRPAVFCMDEPLSNLDAELRRRTRGEIKALQADLGTTMIYVTHDQVEARNLGHRVAVLRGGVLQQVAEPEVLYDRPVNVFVAGFIGDDPMNLIPAGNEGGRLRLGGLELPAPAGAPAEVTVGIRPEDLVPAEDAAGAGAVELEVAMVEWSGADAVAHGEAPVGPGGAPLRLLARLGRDQAPREGDRIRLAARPERCHFFDTATGERLPDAPGGATAAGR